MVILIFPDKNYVEIIINGCYLLKRKLYDHTLCLSTFLIFIHYLIKMYTIYII